MKWQSIASGGRESLTDISKQFPPDTKYNISSAGEIQPPHYSSAALKESVFTLSNNWITTASLLL